MAETADLAAPTLTLPPEEAAFLRAGYEGADVILEYGAGGSTVMAAGLPGRAVTAVESDAAWAERMRAWFDANPPRRAVTIHHADIGPTGKWGAPEGTAAWRRFHRYPLGVWEIGLPHPDLVLLDGRFRAACFLTTLFRVQRPIALYWDDYANRPAYREVERYARPVEVVGRMARFALAPHPIPPADLGWVMNVFTRPQ